MKIRISKQIPMIEISPESNDEMFIVDYSLENIWKGDVDKAYKGMGLKASFKKTRSKYCPLCGHYSPQK